MIVDWLLARSLAGLLALGVIVPLAWLLRRGPAAELCALWGIVLVVLVLPDAPLALVPSAPALSAATDDASAVAPGGSVLGLLWGVGAVGAGLRGASGLLAAQATALWARPSDTLQPLADRWRGQLAIKRSVRVCLSGRQLQPFTTGLLRPRIVLPTTLQHAPEPLLQAVIAHEMAHIARLDAPILILEAIVGALFWFHPAAWIARARRREARERATDALALSTGSICPRAYAGALLAVLRLDLRSTHAPAASPQRRSFEMRIRDILHPHPRRRPILAIAVAAVLLPLSGIADPPLERVHPLPSGRLTLGFEQVADPLGDGQIQHKGVDLAAPHGTPVHAAADGTVTVATTAWAPSLGSGTIVIVDHGSGWTSRYAHLSSLQVIAGDRVLAGDPIGAVGSTGRSTGPHLHFEVRQGAVPQDPRELVPGL